MSAVMQYVEPDSGVVCQWHGGAYIELGYIDESGEFIAGDVINVWDYAKDEPRIPRTLDAFQEVCDERIPELIADES
jgi:hypothetical protein